MVRIECVTFSWCHCMLGSPAALRHALLHILSRLECPKVGFPPGLCRDTCSLSIFLSNNSIVQIFVVANILILCEILEMEWRRFVFLACQLKHSLEHSDCPI